MRYLENPPFREPLSLLIDLADQGFGPVFRYHPPGGRDYVDRRLVLTAPSWADSGSFVVVNYRLLVLGRPVLIAASLDVALINRVFENIDFLLNMVKPVPPAMARQLEKTSV